MHTSTHRSAFIPRQATSSRAILYSTRAADLTPPLPFADLAAMHQHQMCHTGPPRIGLFDALCMTIPTSCLPSTRPICRFSVGRTGMVPAQCSTLYWSLWSCPGDNCRVTTALDAPEPDREQHFFLDSLMNMSTTPRMWDMEQMVMRKKALIGTAGRKAPVAQLCSRNARTSSSCSQIKPRRSFGCDRRFNPIALSTHQHCRSASLLR